MVASTTEKGAGGAGAGTRSAGVQHRAPVIEPRPRIAPGVVRIHRIPDHGVVVAGHAVGHEVGELGERRLRDNHRAGVTQVLRQRGVVRRHQVLERDRAARGADVGGVNVVLEGDRNAVQRSADLARLMLPIETIGLFERLRVDRDHRVQLVVVERDALQVLLDHVTRAGSAVQHRLLQFGNCRLDDGEGNGGRGRRGRRRARAHGRAGNEDCDRERFHAGIMLPIR